MSKIAHASIDENKNTKGGKAGDQTGKEVCVREWWDKGWNKVLRHPDERIGNKAANIAQMLCECNKVGYDQNERNTLHTELKKVGYNVGQYINNGIPTETDCSAFVTLCYIASGIKELEYEGNAPTTRNMANKFVKCGFNEIADSRYLKSPDYLRKGDIILKEGSHVVITLETGVKYGNKNTCYPIYLGYATTLAQALTELGIDSSKEHRKKIYGANYSDEYKYTNYQNTQMFKRLKTGHLIKPEGE